MALWPWWEAISPIRYEKCSFCGNEQPVEGGKVLVCSCAGARQAEIEDRERRVAWVRAQANKPRGRKAKV